MGKLSDCWIDNFVRAIGNDMWLRSEEGSHLVSDGEGRRSSGNRICSAHSAAVAAEGKQLRACRVPSDRCDLVCQALSCHDAVREVLRGVEGYR